MGKAIAIFIPGVYIVGVMFGFGIDFWKYWSVGSVDGFAVMDSLSYASYWPLRLI